MLDCCAIAPFVDLALACVHREYPNQIAHLLEGDEHVAPPRALTPAFYGCFDWHSAVHGHWLLARAARVCPDAAFAATARASLAQSLTAENIAAEVRYLERRRGFERPYGLAWLLTLHGELVRWTEEPAAAEWARALTPLAQVCAGRLRTWLPRLSHPVRTGLHSQTAFAMGLALDWARATRDTELARLVAERARAFHGADRDYALHLEPSGEDFLSPSLGAADLMRRVLEPAALAAWLARTLPVVPADGREDWLVPVQVTDPTDGRLAHLDGLNLSRAWMLEGIAHGLPDSDARRVSLLAAAAAHGEAGLSAVHGRPYEGAHWLGTFAVYLATRAGIG